MIIEFYGLPGAGKTTIAQKLAAKSDFKIVKIRSKKELVLYNLLFLLKHPIKFFVTLYYVIANSSDHRMFYYKFNNAFLHHNAKYQKALAVKNAILDQGYFQNVLSIFEEPIPASFLVKYAGFLLKPDKLVILNLPPDNVLERTSERGYAARERFGREYFSKWLETVVVNNKTFLENLDEMGIDYAIIDASGNVEEICEEILKAGAR